MPKFYFNGQIWTPIPPEPPPDPSTKDNRHRYDYFQFIFKILLPCIISRMLKKFWDFWDKS